MVYLSMLMALEDERVFRKALEAAGNALGVEVFSFAYGAEEMPLLAEKIRAFAGRPMTFHGPMHGVELSQAPLRRAPDAYLRAFTLARQCGARHMVAHTHETHVTLEDKASRMRYCEDNLRLLSREAAEYGVTLCVENVSLPNKGAPLFVYCLSGVRSSQAAARLQKMGYTRVNDIGGIAAYTGKVEK